LGLAVAVAAACSPSGEEGANASGGVAAALGGALAGSSGGSASAGGSLTSGGQAMATGGEISTGGVAPGLGGGLGGGVGGAAESSGGTVSAGGADKVMRSIGTYDFQHFPIEVAETGLWNGGETPGTTLTTTTFDTVILENGYLRVTLLPAYGGRILSIVHKPTGRELLYQNAIGTPYLMHEDIFYYDYLVILGGIFPSFPEPEHGRYWNQPYEFAIVSEGPDAITVRMSRQDNLDVPVGVPSRYEVGRTDLLVELEITLRAGRSNLELNTKLTNPKPSAIPRFEYWTITTLAPGSTPGHAMIPESTRIIAKMDQVHLFESSWSWFGDAEERVNDEVFKWKNLSYFENWVDQGTAFAHPQYEANFSGLINYENSHGVLCVSANVETPGLKLWTFGKDSVHVDINDSSEWLRPTIEMWHGVTPEFWQRGAMEAGEVRTWTDHYFPTLELRDISAASEYGAVYLSSTTSGVNAVLSALATLTVPNQTVHAVMKLSGSVVREEDILVSPAEATTLEVSVPASSVLAGAELSIEFSQESRALLTAKIVLQ